MDGQVPSRIARSTSHSRGLRWVRALAMAPVEDQWPNSSASSHFSSMHSPSGRCSRYVDSGKSRSSHSKALRNWKCGPMG